MPLRSSLADAAAGELTKQPRSSKLLTASSDDSVDGDFAADQPAGSRLLSTSSDGSVAGDFAAADQPTISKDEDDSDSEFSDGVTLDLSIAEVSNLTTPTALMSRTGTDRSVCGESSDPSSKSIDVIEVEAKRSEASSSQPSEAAAPLLARALGLNPKSDELSANSFFAKRALIANHWSKTSSLDSTGKPAEVRRVEDEQETKESSDDSFNAGWDLTRIESSFPLTESTSADDIFDFESEWKPFLATTPKTGLAGAKTPTRSNISARFLPSSRLYPETSRMIPSEPPTVQPIAQTTTTPSLFPRTNPRDDDPSTWRRRAGVTLASIRRETQPPVQSIERLPVRLPPTTRSSSVLTERIGNRHAALMARLKALKEARQRRMAGYTMETPLPDADETSNASTQSSTQFGGSTFFASLEVD
jgi:hypothetical protein